MMSHHWAAHGMGVGMHGTTDPSMLPGMMPYDAFGLGYEPPKPRLVIKLPRVVTDQKGKFETDDLFRRLSRESEVGEICLVQFTSRFYARCSIWCLFHCQLLS